MKNILLLLLLFIVSTFLSAQSCTVNAGSDIVICTSQPVQLNGSGTGLQFHWQSNVGLTDTTLLNPVVTPLNTTTYVLQSEFISPNNLITNSDFSFGNTGFTSGYFYTPPPNLVEGQYWISTGNQIQSWNPGMANCIDHTSGTGNLMMVNGATTVNIPVWCQTVNIQPNTNYAFTCWLETLTLPNPAQLQFSINGIPLGNVFVADTTLCTWQQFYIIWNSGSSITADICIVNQNSVATANDFALDDIGFAPLCTAYDSVTVTIASNLNSNNPQTICIGQSYTLNSHTYTIAGNYQDTVLSTSGCDSIVNTQLSVIPAIVYNNPQLICAGQSYTINSHVYSVAGSYFDTLSSFIGCDSIVNTLLSIFPTVYYNNPQVICSGDSYNINAHTYTTTGNYDDTLNSMGGCDSIVHTQLTVSKYKF